MFVLMKNQPDSPPTAKLLSFVAPYRIQIGEKQYDIEFLDPPDGAIEAVAIRREGKEYAVLSSDRGHYCSCPHFEHRCRFGQMPCRHLHGLIVTHTIRRDLAPYFGAFRNGNQDTSGARASKRADAHETAA